LEDRQDNEPLAGRSVLALSYEKAGVDINAADRAKEEMSSWVARGDSRVLNRLGAFASLFAVPFREYRDPVLVLKTEEPGSKQKLALEHGRVESLARDLVHHLINDIAVMGATPLSVQDAIICGKLEPEVVTGMVRAIAAACREQECTLTGGETSEQPGVLEPGTYVLTASVVGIAEREHIIDGAKIKAGDKVLALASNGLHTNGYSLVRKLLSQDPKLAHRVVDGSTFLDVALRPHLCYYQALRGLYQHAGLHGLAHITGGGIEGNLCRIISQGLQAVIDLPALRVPSVMRVIRESAEATDQDMLKTFNMGAGVAAVVDGDASKEIQEHLNKHGCASYWIGEVVQSSGNKIRFSGSIAW
jgi:phosphoribosylformylglycinamidine cyclo-ligase